MNCRIFHQKLEDYLEGGLDFPARFGVERHADQCYACQKEITTALKLRQMARDFRRVSAPTSLENALMARIQAEKSHRIYWKIGLLWRYGLEGFSWRAAGATAFAAILIVGGIAYFISGGSNEAPIVQSDMLRQVTPPEAGLLQDAKLQESGENRWGSPVFQPGDSEYYEFLIPVSGEGQLMLRLPKRIQMRYDQPSQQYFIRNVSH